MKLACALLLVALSSPLLAQNKYNSTFPTVENPLSESGNWVNGGIGGFTNCQTLAANKVVSTQTSGSGFTDATCVLKGTWGVNQTVTATFHTTNAIEENELRALTTITSGGSITGYEFNCSSGYVEIVRWDGSHPLSFAVLIHDGAHGCLNNDAIKATTDNSGNLKFFINGVQTTATVDTTYKTGGPGLGMNTFLASGGVNSDHWLSDFTATDGVNRAWAGIIDPSRAIDWTKAGLPATLPDGETTPNPWTPPTRTQCGATLTPIGGGSDDRAQIASAISSCTAGHFVLLGAGTFTINSKLALDGALNRSLRGSGPMSTRLNIGSGGSITLGDASGGGSCTLTSGSNYSAGSTVLTCTGSSPTVNQPAWATQCDTGMSGATCATGTEADNGSIWICGFQTICANQPASGGHIWQQQTVLVTNVSGTCASSCTVTISPGLYMPNWAFARSPVLSWNDSTFTAVGVGFENLTVDFTAGTSSNNGTFTISNAYASWIKGVRFIGGNAGPAGLSLASFPNVLFANNYYFATNPITQVSAGLPIQPNKHSASLFVNNITQGGGISSMEQQGNNSGNIYAYNFARDNTTSQVYNGDAQHSPSPNFELREGNQYGPSEDDQTWGTHNFDTWFRNYASCYDPPFIGEAAPRGILIDNYARFESVIGNVLGSTGNCTAYKGSGSNLNEIGFGATDALAQSSAMLWGNYSTVNAGNIFNVAEVPTGLSGVNGTYVNLVPASQTLPASLFFPTGTSSLPWSPVCTSWSSFPTSCSATQTQPFPLMGPDVTGGPYAAGHAYDTPAAVAYKNLPIDAALQNSYTITGSSWSSGTETLTISGLPSPATHTMGGFQLSGANVACAPTSGVSYTGRPDGEILMTGSSTTTVKYAVANPGVSCTGSMKFPDVRQFDERVFGATASASPFVSLSPSSLTFSSFTVGVTSASQPVTLSNTGGAALSIASIIASGDFSQSNNCPASLGISLSCTINVTFTPTNAGSRAGSVSIVDNASGSPHLVALTGTGVAPTIYRPTTSADSGTAPTSNPQFAYDGNFATAAFMTSSDTQSTDVAFFGIPALIGTTPTATLFVQSSVTFSGTGVKAASAQYSLNGGTTWSNIWVSSGTNRLETLDSVVLSPAQNFTQVQTRFQGGCANPGCSVNINGVEIWIQTVGAQSGFSGGNLIQGSVIQ